MEDGLRKLKIKKEFCRFSVDAETANFITKFTVIDDTMSCIAKDITTYRTINELYEALDSKVYDDYWLERVEVDFKFGDIMYYIRHK